LVMPRMNMPKPKKYSRCAMLNIFPELCAPLEPRAVHPNSEGENGPFSTKPHSFFAIELLEIRQSESLIGTDRVGAHLSTPS